MCFCLASLQHPKVCVFYATGDKANFVCLPVSMLQAIIE